VRLFLDSSVILSACGSEKSLSRLITLLAPERGWTLVSSAYCRAEISRNIGKFGAPAMAHWAALRAELTWVRFASGKVRSGVRAAGARPRGYSSGCR